MFELLTILAHFPAALAPYSAMCRVVLAFIFLILLRVTVPRIKVEGISRWGWVIGWVMASISAAVAVLVWLLS